MRALVLRENGPVFEDHDPPTPRPSEVLVPPHTSERLSEGSYNPNIRISFL